MKRWMNKLMDGWSHGQKDRVIDKIMDAWLNG